MMVGMFRVGLLAGAVLAAGCGPAPKDMIDEELDLCPPAEQTPAFGPLGTGITDAEVGACGHLLYLQDGTQFLLSPDYATSEPLASEPRIGKFSHTGHLVAWEAGDGVTLRNLWDDSEIHEDGVSAFGFVPSVDPERGARLWVCKGGEVGRLDIDLGYRELDVATDCGQSGVLGATLAPKVVYAADGALRVVDVDRETEVELPVEYRQEFSGDGPRADTFEISPRGELVVHHQMHIEYPENSDTDRLVHDNTTVLASATGELLTSSAKSLGMLADASGHNLLVRSGDQAWVFEDGGLSALPSEFQVKAWLPDGQLLVHDGEGLGRLRPGDNQFRSWIAGAIHIADYAFDTTGTHLIARVDTEGCIANPNHGECTMIVSELQVAATDAATRVLMLFSFGLDALALADSGSAFVETGRITNLAAEDVSHGAFVLASDGEVLREWVGEAGDVQVRRLHNTGEAFVVMLQQPSGTAIEFVDAVSGDTTQLVPDVSFDVDLRVDGEYAVVHDGGRDELWAGMLP